MPRLPRDLVVGSFLIPRVVAGLIAATLLASLATATIGAPLLLSARGVWAGEVWRLLSFGLVAPEPLALLFGCLTLYGFARDLYTAWGEAGLLRTFAGLTLGAAVITTATSRVWPTVGMMPFAGQWAVLGGLMVIWGRLFPGRSIRWFGILTLTGRHVVWATIGVTLLFVLYYGLASFLPHVTAELLALLYMGPIRRWRARRLAARSARPVTAAGSTRPETFEEWLAREWPRR